MKNVLNIGNDNNLKGDYPIFLGDDLGFSDEINITYQTIQNIHEKQQAMFWLASEFHFNQDRLDMVEAPDSERDVMVLNLLAQWLLDSTASRSIIEIFGPLTSNNEAHNWFLTQSFFEGIHASTYAKIIRNCFTDGNEVLERGKSNLDIFNRCKRIGEVFNELNKAMCQWQLGELTDIRVMKYKILKGVFTLYALEQVSFSSSFAPTFALVETGRYQNIGKAVSSIANDESVHAEGDLEILEVLLKKEDGYQEIFSEHRDEFTTLFNEIVKQELDWSEYIFQEGRKVLGLNTELLKSYVAYVALPCYENLGLAYPYEMLGEKVNKNPLPYMDKYLKRDTVQNANQEITNNNYKVGQTVNDLDDEEFDLDF